MKTHQMISRWATLCLLLLACTFGTSCMTTYDSAGRPVQSVDPGLAVAGVAAAGLVGYAIANNNGGHRHYRGYGGYYRPYPGNHCGYY
ncbi:MAG: hypothetical protein MUF86_04990 [Akkermansiaceae bacterium]|nr:hypothetical protein [Akkermansiaceae bacterium]